VAQFLEFVHGNTGRAENLANVQFQPRGPGGFFSAPINSDSIEWIDYSLQVRRQGTNFPRLSIVQLRFNTFDSGVLTHVHVWEGDSRREAFDGLEFAGEHLTDIVRISLPAPLLFGDGLSIILGYQFDPLHRGSQLFVASVGIFYDL
jgi:hypothetical protein